MENCEPLVWFGSCVLLVVGGLVLIPYLRRKSDLLTGWNLLLLGMGIFVGLGCFSAASSGLRQESLQWFQPTKDEVRWYMVATFVFSIVLLLAYYNPWSRAVTSRCLRKWPPQTTPVFLSVIAFCLLIQAVSFFTAGMTFLGPMMFKFSHKAGVCACVFSFLLWYRNRINIFWFAVFLAIFFWSSIFSMLVYAGRRLLLSIFLVPILWVYWTHIRHWRPTRGLAALGLAAVFILVISMAYNSFRWFSSGRYGQERTAAAIVEQMKQIGTRPWLERFATDKLFYFAQQCTHYSLFVQRHVNNGELTPKPLNTMLFALTYPIPRKIWPGKPVEIGSVITRVARMPTTNWGVGIAGHGAYEGGIPTLVLYAVLAAIGIRFIDDPMKQQPTNPFLIFILAAASPHILAWPRGDLFNMTIETAECFLFAILLGICFRLIFGTERNSPLTSHQQSPLIRASQ